MTAVAAKCGAKTRSGGRCRLVAGWGTDHVGEGRCKLHGGASLKGPDHPRWKHGRYSKVQHESLRELLAKMEDDPDPLDTKPEIALLRALVHDWTDRYTDLVDALLAWNQEEYREAEEEGRPPRPARIPEIHEVRPLLSEISKSVARIERAQAQNAISRPDLMRLMQEMARVVERHVEDPDVLEAIKDGWLEIRVA